MIAPGSIADWALLTGLLGSLSALAVGTHRFVLRETPTPERIRSHPITAPGRARRSAPMPNTLAAAPTREYAPIADGLSSDAPLTIPGPRVRK